MVMRKKKYGHTAVNNAQLKDEYIGKIKSARTTIELSEAILETIWLKDKGVLKITIEEIAEASKIHRTILSLARKALQEQSWQKLSQKIAESNYTFSSYFANYYRSAKLETNKSFNQIEHEVIKYFDDVINPNRQQEADLLIHKLRNLVPPEIALKNIYLLSYSNCVCCNKVGIDKGHPLREVEGMLMPICDTCYRGDYIQKINWRNVAKIYHRYAMVYEEAADHYTNHIAI